MTRDNVYYTFQVFYKRVDPGDINYNVQQATGNRKKRQTISALAKSAAVNLRIPDLSPGDNYTFEVQAINEHGFEVGLRFKGLGLK